MFIYWIIFLVFASGALLNQENHVGRTRLMFVMLAAVPTALMIGLRWQIGPDWPAYFDIFTYTKLFTLTRALSHADPGYMMLNLALHQFGAPFWALNLICGTIFVAGLTAFCRRQPNPWLAYLVAFPYLVIVVAMSGNRQSVALGLLFFALNAFERERLGRFVLFILLAALFHGSILLILPLCLLSYSRNNLQSALLLIGAAVLGVYFFHDVFSIYARRYSTDKIQSTGVVYRLAMNAMAAILYLVFRKRFALEDHQASLWRNISLCTLSLVLLSIVFPSSTAIDRFLLYLFPLQFIVLSRLPKVLGGDGRATRAATIGVIAYAALVQITFLLFGTFARYYIPYRWIFNA